MYDSYIENSDLQIRQCIERDIYGTFHKVQNKGNKKATVHDVFVPESTNDHPSCLCKIFKSKLLPCRHICRVLTFYLWRTVFDISTLHEYWHLIAHPLYEETKN